MRDDQTPAETWQSGTIVVERFPLGRHATNAYLVYGTTRRRGVLIDPATDGEALMRRVTACGVTLTAVVLTHAHWDHVGAAGYVAECAGVPVHLHAADRPLLRAAPIYAFRIGGERLQVPAETIDLRDGSTVPVDADLSLGIRHVPGHTPGGVACRVGTSLFSGDTLLHEAVGRHDLPGGDAAALSASIAALRADLGAGDVVCPGHGPIWPAAAALAWLDAMAEARA